MIFLVEYLNTKTINVHIYLILHDISSKFSMNYIDNKNII